MHCIRKKLLRIYPLFMANVITSRIYDGDLMKPIQTYKQIMLKAAGFLKYLRNC